MYRVFPEYDIIDFTGNFQAQMRIKHSEVRVCMFMINHPEYPITYIDTKTGLPTITNLKTISILYSFKDLDNDRGALGVYKGFDQSTMTKPIEGRDNVDKSFADVARKISKRENFTLIYNGARNEG